VSALLFSRQFKRVSVILAILVGVLHAGLWLWFQEQRPAVDFHGRLKSMSYTAFEGVKRERGDGFVPSADQIRADMKAMAPLTRAVRTYTVTEGADQIPAIADEFGIRVTLGAWLDNDPTRNQREFDSVIALAKKHRNVDGIYVGNELNVRGEVPLLKGESLTAKEREILAGNDKDAKERVTIDHLIKVIRKVRAETGGTVPLTTGEIYTVWLKYPELVEAVDFLSIHILPYWEGIPAAQAVENVFEMHAKLQAAYPNKRIVVGEFGWPSDGRMRLDSVPSRVKQASFMRQFLARADRLGPRLLRHRSLRPALEALHRRRRRCLLGHLERRPHAQVRLPGLAAGAAELADARRPVGGAGRPLHPYLLPPRQLPALPRSDGVMPPSCRRWPIGTVWVGYVTATKYLTADGHVRLGRAAAGDGAARRHPAGRGPRDDRRPVVADHAARLPPAEGRGRAALAEGLDPRSGLREPPEMLKQTLDSGGAARTTRISNAW
jgi:exo-beta-1,3-glucanase (GH17 family)